LTPSDYLLANWKVILLLVFGIVAVCNGVRIWIRKVMKVADPFLWVPLTGGLGSFIVRFLFDDEEIRGIPARLAAVFQVGYGLLLLSVFFFIGIWPHYFSKTAKRLPDPEPAEEMAYISEEEEEEEEEFDSPAPMTPADAPPVAAAQPVPAAAPVTPQAAPSPPPAPAPEKSGTIQRMSKGWMPEGIQRR
jgi:hypothetical protein